MITMLAGRCNSVGQTLSVPIVPPLYQDNKTEEVSGSREFIARLLQNCGQIQGRFDTLLYRVVLCVKLVKD